ncbi:MAG: GNAT family N-acetyltransferase [Anaerolineales bacterium]|nr:GNAT family N-acetyltransferase [Anaerolineales bacterium]
MNADNDMLPESPAHPVGMTAFPRPYREASDFERMKDVLIAGRQARNGSYYIHIGDLCWWVYYPSFHENPREYIYLWDDPDSSGQLAGWILLSPKWRTFDVFVSPKFHQSEQAVAMFAWSIQRITQIVIESNGSSIRTMWVHENDRWVISRLQAYGFEREACEMFYMERSLEEPISAAALPPGFQARHVAGEQDARQRAASSHAAFDADVPFEQYLQRYLSFMRSPAYATEQDMVVQAPDGRFAAFCYCWLDATNRVGLFEPVGAHPDFQRRGLGKAVLTEGMRQMRAHGMRTAAVCVESDNHAAQRLYQSVGFQVIHTLDTYQKRIGS